MSASVTRPEETALFLADRCAELEAENAKQSNLLRWRNANEEPPQEPTVCLVVLGNNAYVDVTTWTKESPWHTGIITHWRPIGPLPGGE
jgi:hypothetical protein